MGFMMSVYIRIALGVGFVNVLFTDTRGNGYKGLVDK